MVYRDWNLFPQVVVETFQDWIVVGIGAENPLYQYDLASTSEYSLLHSGLEQNIRITLLTMPCTWSSGHLTDFGNF